MRVTIIRHGKTRANDEHLYAGRYTDYELSETGEAEVRQFGNDESVGTVYVTPLMRTKQTAAILFPNTEQRVVDDLAEMDFGAFEGHSPNEMAAWTPYHDWVTVDNCETPCPNGEGREGFTKRICDTFNQLVADCAERGEDDVWVVAHGGTIMALMYTYALPKRDYYDWTVSNVAGFQFEVDPETWTDEPLINRPRMIVGPGK